MPAVPQDVQHVYRFVPAGLGGQTGPETTVITVGQHLAKGTIDAIGAAALPAGAGGQNGQAQLYLAVRNHIDSPLAVRVRVEVLGPDLAGWRQAGQSEAVVPAGGRSGLVFGVESGEAFRAVLTRASALEPQEQGRVLDIAQVARVGAAVRKVAIVGRDEPLLRRFIQADRSLELVGQAGEADFVLANLAEPPPDKPALVIDPPSEPPGWQRGPLRRAITLADANVAADDPLLAGVNLSAVAVRRVRPWTPLEGSAFVPLVSVGGGAVILAGPSRAGGPAGQGRPARIYVAFELSGDNTNLGVSESFVVLLANAAASLAPPGGAGPAYECVTPIQAPLAAGWKRISPPADRLPEQARAYASGGLPEPGVYLDQAGRVRAVSLVGLGAAPQSGNAPKPAGAPAPADGLQAVAAAPLPQPRAVGTQIELWPLLAVAALALWLAGWAMRMR